MNLVPDPTMFELIEIESVEFDGYSNCYDISVAGDHSFILANGVVSHNSALGGLMPVLGRENVGYFTLKGKPLNAYSQSHKKFIENKELSGLYQVLTNDVNIKELSEGEFYRITLDDGSTAIANINDEVKLNGKWVSVKDLIKS